MLVPVSGLVFSLEDVFCLTDAKTCKCWHPHSRGRCRGRDALTGWWCNTLLWWWSSLNEFLCVFESLWWKNVSVYSFCWETRVSTAQSDRLVFNVFLLKTPLWFECICTKDWCVTWPLNHCGQCDLIRFGSHVKVIVLWTKEKQTQTVK